MQFFLIAVKLIYFRVKLVYHNLLIFYIGKQAVHELHVLRAYILDHIGIHKEIIPVVRAAQQRYRVGTVAYVQRSREL